MIGSVSVIVPSLGRVERLRECVGAILRQDVSVPLDVAVVIDGPESGRAVDALRSAFPGEKRIKYDASPARRGSPSAKNIGASMVGGEVLVFVDDDTVPAPGWLSTIVKAYEAGIAGVGGSEEKQASPGWLRKMWVRFWGDATGKVTKSGLVISNFAPTKTTVEKVDCLAGANMSFLREVFEGAGGFDANYKGTAYREETDLCLRVRQKGILLFVPAARVLHREEQAGGNSPESARDWNYWYHRNNTYFFLKNLDNGSETLRFRHGAVEVALALGRALQQRSLTPLTTLRAATRDGRTAFEELGESRRARNDG
jgi:GT2 family glycosyltransferase